MNILTHVESSGSVDEIIAFVSEFVSSYGEDFNNVGMDVIFTSVFILFLVLVVFLSLRK